jgi:hypothetical protein
MRCGCGRCRPHEAGQGESSVVVVVPEAVAAQGLGIRRFHNHLPECAESTTGGSASGAKEQVNAIRGLLRHPSGVHAAGVP